VPELPRTHRRTARVWAATTAGAALLASLTLSAGAHAAVPGRRPPSPAQIAAARAQAAQRARQVTATQARIARTKSRLATLNTQAEIATEAYDAAMVRLGQAQQAEHSAQVALNAANAQLNHAQQQVNAFAAMTYKTGSGWSQFQLVVSSAGIADYLSRAGMLQAVTGRQRDLVETLTGARAYQHVVEEQTARTLAASQSAGRAAAAAKAAAQSRVSTQRSWLGRLQGQERHLVALLSAARSHVRSLQQERAAALAAAAAAARARALAAARTAAASAVPAVAPVSGNPASVAVAWAYRELGKPYVWAAAGPDAFDCSGLTMYVYAKAGIQLLHYTGDQWNEGVHVSQGQLQPGDLVFFATNTSDPSTIHHVGIYIGNGEMINAPETGELVSIAPAFRSDYIGAVRPYGVG